MKVSLNWLKEFLPDFSYNSITKEILELAGLEIESEILLPLTFKNIHIGEIVEIERHNRKKNLLLTKVKILEQKSCLKQIVCGAHNIKVGDLVPVALPGSIVDNKVIETKVIAGMTSAGMLLSLNELGFPHEFFSGAHDGIFIIKEPSDILDLNLILSLPDTILEFKIFPNRSDMLSIYGMAREISNILNIPLSGNFNLSEPKTSQGNIKINNKNFRDCKYYSASLLEGVSVSESSSSLQIKLLKTGFRPINNIVDIANYVMVELGQPLHTFDADLVNDDEIFIRRGYTGESILCLDNNLKSVDDSILVIANNKEPIAIAGIIGGLHSGITEKTKNIILEAAHFSAEVIRSGRRKLSISTDASYRFERDLDPFLPQVARNRFLELFRLHKNINHENTTVSFVSPLIEHNIISFTKTELNSFLGIELSATEISQTIKFLPCSFKEDVFTVVPPSFRKDIKIPQDIFEEVGKLVGYNKIPGMLPPPYYKPIAQETEVKKQLRNIMINSGFTEVINQSIVNNEELSFINKPLKIINPLNKNESNFRSSLLPGLLNTFLFNFKNNWKNIFIFEVGNIYRDQEISSFAFLFTGELFQKHWTKNNFTPDFYFLTGLINLIAKELNFAINCNNIKPELINQKAYNFFHPNRRMVIMSEEKEIGYLGQINPGLTLDNKQSIENIFAAELFINSVSLLNPKFSVIEPSKYPSVERHLSFLFPDYVKYNQIQECLQALQLNYLINYALLDVFTDIGYKNRLSYTFSFIFNDSTGTLIDSMVNIELEKIIKSIISIGGTLRGNP